MIRISFLLHCSSSLAPSNDTSYLHNYLKLKKEHNLTQELPLFPLELPQTSAKHPAVLCNVFVNSLCQFTICNIFFFYIKTYKKHTSQNQPNLPIDTSVHHWLPQGEISFVPLRPWKKLQILITFGLSTSPVKFEAQTGWPQLLHVSWDAKWISACQHIVNIYSYISSVSS